MLGPERNVDPHAPRSAQRRLMRSGIAVLLTLGLTALIALGLGLTSVALNVSLVATIAILVTVVHFLFPGSFFFSVVFANMVGAYACIYAFTIEGRFYAVSDLAAVGGFVMPLLGFLAGIVLRRAQIQRMISAEGDIPPARFDEAFGWLIPVTIIGIAVLAVPFPQAGAGTQEAVLLGAMALIALIVFLASRNVAAFLLDTGILFEDFFSVFADLAKPLVAFLTFYTLNIIVFAAIYRVVGFLDGEATFVVAGSPRDLSFAESLYFSVVSLSTVGFGDISPLTASARALAAIQQIFGIVLLLFGVHAILRHARR